MDSLNLTRVYQPIPFEEYNDVEFEREDCKNRFEAIHNSYGSFEEQSLFTSAADGHIDSLAYEGFLKSKYTNVVNLGTFFNERILFRCDEKRGLKNV